MKKLLAMALACGMVLAMTACGSEETKTTPTPSVAPTEAPTTAPTEEPTEAPTTAPTEEPTVAPTEAPVADDVMTYDEYIAAELESEVVVTCYVQAMQSWWDNKATVYAQDEDGAYFLYNMACSEEDYAKLTKGTQIKVTGFKAEWAGEVEIIDATFEIIEGSFVAEALDVTELLGTDELIAHQNEFVSFTGMTVCDAGNGSAFMYNWDGSGSDGNDLYFKVSVNGAEYTFTVESYLCGAGTEVYEAVKALEIGQVIDMEGFLYWYEGVNPHITSVTVAE